MTVRLLVPALAALVGCSAEPGSFSQIQPEAAAPQAGQKAVPSDTPRRIVYTASVDVVVEQLGPAEARVRELVAGFGGYVAKAETVGRAEFRRRATLVVRVPVARFPAAVEAFAGLGAVARTSTDSQDVTEEFVDAEARLRNYKAEEAALNKLLESAAGKLEDVLKIREQVVRTRTEIERVEGRLKYLASQTDLSTVTLNLSEETEAGPTRARPLGTRLGEQFRWSVGQGQLFAENLLLAAVAALPWLPGVLLVVWLVRRWRRRKRA